MALASPHASYAAVPATGIRTTRAWAWFGLAAFVIGFVFTWAPAAFGISTLESENPDLLFEALDTNSNLWIGRVTSGLGFLAVGALIVFATGFRRLLEKRMPQSLIPGVVHTTLVATAGALFVASIFRAMLFDSIDSYDNSAHAVFYALSWDVALAGWASIFIAAIATAVAALKFGALPKWFGWVSAVMAFLGCVMVMTGLAFPAHMPAFIWLISASVVGLKANDA